MSDRSTRIWVDWDDFVRPINKLAVSLKKIRKTKHMYRQVKAEKLSKEFNYLKTKSYFPFGTEGREFKITDIEKRLPELQFSPLMLQVNKYKNPNYKTESLEEHQNGENWKVIVIITDEKDKIEVELEEALKVLKIRHDIEKSFND